MRETGRNRAQRLTQPRIQLRPCFGLFLIKARLTLGDFSFGFANGGVLLQYVAPVGVDQGLVKKWGHHEGKLKRVFGVVRCHVRSSCVLFDPRDGLLKVVLRDLVFDLRLQNA